MSKYFSREQWTFVAFILTLGFCLRFGNLDHRAYHHDESIHTVYGNYIYENPEEKYYRYQPLLHGPMLYNIYPFFYQMLGVNQWSGRAPIALLGCLLTILPLFFWRFFRPKTMLFLVTFFSLSPSFVYWSRLIHHDLLVLATLVTMLYGVVLAPPKLKNFLVAWMFILQFCIKENSYITSTLILAYLFFEHYFCRYFCSPIIEEKNSAPQKSHAERMIAHIKAYPISLCLGTALGVYTFVYLYSAGFRYSEGILDGLWRKSISYWLEQHAVERIKGPFLFYFYFLSWYDFPFVVLLLAHLGHFYKKTSRAIRWSGLIAFTFSLLLYLGLFQSKILFLIPIWDFFRFKSPLDAFGPLLLFVHAVNITIDHLKKGEKTLAFMGYFFMANFFTYSFLGEKVPWLSVYTFFPGTLYLFLYWEKYRGMARQELLPWLIRAFVLVTACTLVFIGQAMPDDNNIPWVILSSALGLGALALHRSSPATRSFSLRMDYLGLALLFCFSLRMALITNFGREGEQTEFISQVHTTQAFHKLAMHIESEILAPIDGIRPTVLTMGAAIWPMTWYMRNAGRLYHFNLQPFEKKEDFDYIIQDTGYDLMALNKTHNTQFVSLRSWWVPQYEEMNLKRFLIYAFHHVPWNSPGSMTILFAKKKPAL